jgi:hypothetical protein
MPAHKGLISAATDRFDFSVWPETLALIDHLGDRLHASRPFAGRLIMADYKLGSSLLRHSFGIPRLADLQALYDAPLDMRVSTMSPGYWRFEQGTRQWLNDLAPTAGVKSAAWAGRLILGYNAAVLNGQPLDAVQSLVEQLQVTPDRVVRRPDN